MSSTEKSKDLFIPIERLVEQEAEFVVRDYQRGYKWTEKHISALLNDIYHHNANDGRYCLQPLIVFPTDKVNAFELIDGQQRLTSIYLLLSYLRERHPVGYTISYETREKSKLFVASKVPKLFNWIKTQANGATWEAFIHDEEFSAYDNVDVYHFFLVATTIHEWFTTHSLEVDRQDYTKKLLELVHVIWYDASGSGARNSNLPIESFAKDVFLNLNAGKIPLTGSELIKGLFILECQQLYSKEIAQLKTNELAAEWDSIENHFQDDTFWYFANSNIFYRESPTRIDFLLDLVNGVTGQDKIAAYRKYEEQFYKKEPLNWQEVKIVYNKLVEWYTDKDTYHYIGFLVATKLSNLQKILHGSKGKTKAEFKDYLQEEIKKEFRRKFTTEEGELAGIYDLDLLNYEDGRKECERLLLWLNVCYYINSHSSNRFPFELYQKDKWSVEHINPQNPREFETVEMLRDWIQAHIDYFDNPDVRDNWTNAGKAVREMGLVILDQIGDLDSNQSAKEIPVEAKVRLDALTDHLTAEMGLHTIGNLALLDRTSNSRLSNKPFLDKRELILKFDQNGHTQAGGNGKSVFIPVCTKDVFLKVHTIDKARVADAFFGKADMEAYTAFVQQQLTKSLN